MWGRIIRAPLYAGIGALCAWVLSYVIPKVLDPISQSNTMLLNSLTAVEEHSLTIMFLAVLLGLAAGAVTESKLGRGI